MKVLQIIPAFVLGGAENMCEALACSLQENGCSVVVVSLFSINSPITERLEKKNIKVLYLDKKAGFDFSLIKKLYKIYKEEKPDVVHMHLNSILVAMPVAVFTKIPVRINTIHSIASKEGSGLTRFIKRINIHVFKMIPVALTSNVQESICSYYKIKPNRSPIVFNGIDLNRCEIKQSYDYGKQFNILHIGRFNSAKNHLGLIEAFGLIHKKYPFTVLNLIGEGELKSEIEESIQKFGLSDCVCLLGAQKDCFHHLHMADALVLPSLREGMPMVLIEAMGTGLPVVASEIGGIPDMISNGIEGLLIKPEVDEIVSAIEKLILNQELREYLGRNARERSKSFSADCMAKKYIEIYRRKA